METNLENEASAARPSRETIPSVEALFPARVLARWLLVVAALVFAMVVVGGITRLTGSGLSITEWRPLTGVLPPLTEAGWQVQFEKYRQFSQFKLLNGPAGMTLGEFRFIYFWEWLHRLLARLTGLAFALPLIWFWARRKIPAGFKSPMLGLLALGGLQGVAGWWMVVSGLGQRPEVSPYRLAVHLMLALVLLGGLIWTALDLRLHARRPGARARLTGFGALVLVVLFIGLLLGALVAGFKAGYVSNTWPLMYGRLVPPGFALSMDTLGMALRHPVLVHFIHRWWAWLMVVALVILARRIRREHRMASIVLHSAFGIQIVLGVSTVITGVHFLPALLHQAVGALVVASTIWCLHILGCRPLTR